MRVTGHVSSDYLNPQLAPETKDCVSLSIDDGVDPLSALLPPPREVTWQALIGF